MSKKSLQMRFLHRYLSNTVSGAASFPGQDLSQIDRALRYSADKNREGENSLQRHKRGKRGPGYVGSDGTNVV